MKSIFAVLAVFVLPFSAMAGPGALPGLSDALDANDTAAIEPFSAGDSAEAQLAGGVLAALRGQEHRALADLAAASADERLAPDLRRSAWSAMSGIYLRQGRYAEAADALTAADAAAPARDEAAALNSAQSRVFARTAAAAGPMGAQVSDQGKARIFRDLAGLPRVNAVIQGADQEAVVDTGANFSVVMASVAKSLGIRLLDGDISVGASASDDVAGRLGIATTLRLAGGEYTDVLFIVMPDEALSFAGGAYTIPAIIGLPVLAPLGRVSFERDGEEEWLRHEASDAGWSEGSNLLLIGLSPVAMIEANGHPVRMFIDSGATESHLTPRAVRDYPGLLEGAASASTRIGGAGGERVFEDAATLPELTVTVGDARVSLTGIHILGEDEDGRHGLIGQDVLQAMGGYVLDFGARRFELLPGAPVTP